MIKLKCKKTPNKHAPFSEGSVYTVTELNHKAGDSAGTVKIENDKGKSTMCSFYLTKKKELVAASCLFRVQLVLD